MTTKAADSKKKTVKKTAKKTTAKTTVKKNSAKGFLNWSIPMANGKDYRSSKGFPIFQNPEYQNDQEDTLLELAKQNGGVVELTMKVRVVLIDKPEAEALDFSAFVLG